LRAYFCTALADKSYRQSSKPFIMEQTKKNTLVWWLVFLASTAALIFAIYSHWPWLTLILPFQTTSFVKAMDIM
jgi:hypothetical protein